MSDATQYVFYMSPTEPGFRHDIAIAQDYPITLPKDSSLFQDKGFIGHKPEGVIIEQPFKKPKNGKLTFSQLLYNQMLSSSRIVIEHVNSGVKRLRIVQDNIRLKTTAKRDLVMFIACGLHNLRVLSPLRGYPALTEYPMRA